MTTIPTIPTRDTIGIYSGGFSSTTTNVTSTFTYLRSDGSSIFRSDGTSSFIRP